MERTKQNISTYIGNSLYSGYKDVVDSLVRGGANVNHANQIGATALIYATFSGKINKVKKNNIFSRMNSFRCVLLFRTQGDC